MKSNVKQSVSVFRCNLRRIRHWLVEKEPVGTAATLCTENRLRMLKPASICRISSLSSSSSMYLFEPSKTSPSTSKFFSRTFGSPPLDETQGPAPIDYGSLLQEDEFHMLADATIEDLQEKFEEYGDDVQIDGFDIDYGNQVLTLKLGSLGTYVLNKQTPNRQIWLSSPVSGPSRFDWDRDSQAWVYRRTKAKLLQLLESEAEQLCGKPICLS